MLNVFNSTTQTLIQSVLEIQHSAFTLLNVINLILYFRCELFVIYSVHFWEIKAYVLLQISSIFFRNNCVIYIYFLRGIYQAKNSKMWALTVDKMPQCYYPYTEWWMEFVSRGHNIQKKTFGTVICLYTLLQILCYLHMNII